MKTLLGLRPADLLTLCFLILLAAVSAVFYDKLPDGKALIFLYLLLLFIQILLIKRREKAVSNEAMHYLQAIIFPVLCVALTFDSLGRIVHYINPEDIDPLLIKLDYLIFRGHPTVMLEAIQFPVFTDILQVAYITHFILPIMLGVVLIKKGMTAEFDKTLFLILLCFYLSFIGYMLMPAIGPRFTIAHLQTTELKGLFVADIIQEILNKLEGIKRDAFPSGHTAVALVVSALAYRFHRGFFCVTLPVIVLLIFSTVYCRYHYVVDVLAGGILAGITIFIGDRYYDRWEARNNADTF